MRKLYAVGDVHGCQVALQGALAQIESDRAGDDATVVFLGDYIDRGSDTAGVVYSIRALKENPPEGLEVVLLRGNHEDMMFRTMLNVSFDPDNGGADFAAEVWIGNGGSDTLKSYNNDQGRLRKDADWLFENTVLTHRVGDFLFVHAGIDPGFPLDDQSEDDMLWSRKFNSYSGTYPEGVFVVHGHTPLYDGPELVGNQLNIDTGCVFGASTSRWKNTNPRNMFCLTTAVLHNGFENKKDISFFSSYE